MMTLFSKTSLQVGSNDIFIFMFYNRGKMSIGAIKKYLNALRRATKIGQELNNVIKMRCLNYILYAQLPYSKEDLKCKKSST